jgi:uncharacterized YccA/Bax inhibitor family protein
MTTSNPTLNESTFQSAGVSTNPMTLQGTVNKTGILLALVIAPAIYTFGQTTANPGSAMVWMIAGLIVGLIAALVTTFKMEWAPITAPVYAIAEGLALGGISAMYNMQFHGIVIQAVMLTVGVLGVMLALYTMRILQPTQKFMMGVFAATGAIALTYLVSMVLGFFGISIPFIHSNGLFGIGFSVVVVIVAALNLIMDFGLIESGIRSRAPKYMEWYGGFSLLVTLVWLYLEILRLLSKLASRRD